MQKYKKAFTLVEILIVLVICWLLFAILFRTYGKITDIAFKTEREKNMNQELVYLSQVLQNLSDDYTIDYAKYTQKNTWEFALQRDDVSTNLVKSTWITSILYLTGKHEHTQYQDIALYSAGECLTEPIALSQTETKQWCRLEMQITPRWRKMATAKPQKVALTDTGKVVFTKVYFKIIPYATPENFYNGNTQENIAKYIASNGFWILTTAYIPYYRADKWVNKSKILIQNFFNN